MNPPDGPADKLETVRVEVASLLGEVEVAAVEPRCAHFALCGGCQLQHLPYPVQLAYKREVVRRAFAEAGLQVGETLAPVAGMDDPWHYRNKADLNVRSAGGTAQLGFSRHDGRGVVEVRDCPISSAAINEALAAFRELLPAFPTLRRKLHSVIVRSSLLEGKVAVLYHTRLKDAEVFAALSRQLMERCPSVKGAAFVDHRREVAVGETRLTERILGLDYTYGLGSFFQANPRQTEVLVERVLALAGVESGDVVADIYSGVGLFTMQLARRAREVYAIEDTPAAVADAEANAARLGLGNCKFLRGQAHERLEALDLFRTKLDLVVLDPPRSGCAEKVLALLPRFAPRRIVYVSCNPVSLARDAASLVGAGFKLVALEPVDMFPQTSHLECVACLERG